MKYKNTDKRIKLGDRVTCTSSKNEAVKVVVALNRPFVTLQYPNDSKGEFNHQTRHENISLKERAK